MARVVVTPRAVENLRDLVDALGLSQDAPLRVERSLQMLAQFPLAGRALTREWAGTRFLIGPWPWMLLIYVYDDQDDVAYVIAIQDGRSGSAATGRGL